MRQIEKERETPTGIRDATQNSGQLVSGGTIVASMKSGWTQFRVAITEPKDYEKYILHCEETEMHLV